MNKVQLFNGIAGLVNSLICGPIIDNLGWQYLHLVCAVGAFASAIYLLFFTQDKGAHIEQKFDYFGSITLIVAVASLCLALTLLSSNYYAICGIFFASAVIFIVLFIFIEKKHKNPILPLQILKQPLPEIMLLNFFGFIFGNGSMYLFPQYAAFKNMSTTFIGLIAASQGVLCLFSVIGLMVFQKRFVNRYILFVSMGICALLLIATGMTAFNFAAYTVIFVISSVFFALI